MRRNIKEMNDLCYYTINIEKGLFVFDDNPPTVYKDDKSNYFRLIFFYKPFMSNFPPEMADDMIHVSQHEYEFYDIEKTNKQIKIVFKKFKNMDNDKFTAEDARKLVKQQNLANMSEIVDDIKASIYRGEDCLEIMDKILPDPIIKELENRGFTVTKKFSPKNEYITIIKWD